ncbi:hypothetical protein ACFSX5_15925 [Devosia albogilva]|uniref:Uncharacterized protein n=1 Tax=Devosia albogilva TaxID=429726 RepID=A0ABW5QNP0_9HYPH
MQDSQNQSGKPEQQDRSPARNKDQQRPKQTQSKDDLPGADGERSAGANEDTYD